MRKKFILFVLIPLIIVAVVVYFFIDRWVEAGLEYAGENAVGAKVEIDHLSVTLSPVGLKFARLQVADPDDPWKNLFETGKVQFAMNFGQLLRGKYIIETAEVNDLIVGTKRTTDGSLPEGRRVAAKNDIHRHYEQFCAARRNSACRNGSSSIPCWILRCFVPGSMWIVF